MKQRTSGALLLILIIAVSARQESTLLGKSMVSLYRGVRSGSERLQRALQRRRPRRLPPPSSFLSRDARESIGPPQRAVSP